MSRFCVALGLAGVLASAPASWAESTEPRVRILSPADRAVVVLGDPVRVEVVLAPSLEGPPLSLRLDGRGVWVTNQGPYQKRFDSAAWGPGQHVLEAVVLLGEDGDDVTSDPVWISVLADEPEPPVTARDDREPPGTTGDERRATAAPPALPIYDDFADGWLDEALWDVAGDAEGITLGEGDNELRVAGTSRRDGLAYREVYTRPFANQSVDASIYFRAPVLSGAEVPHVAFSLYSHDPRGAFGVYYDPEEGYFADVRRGAERTRPVEPYGDEATEWHQLRVTYDASTRMARGYVDGYLLGSYEVELGMLAVSVVVGAEAADSVVDVRFDDFAVGPLRADGEDTSTPTAEEDVKWERDPYVGSDAPLVPGQIVERRTSRGDYFEYVPPNVQEPLRIAVVVHGSYGDQQMGRELSRISARRALHESGWLLLADTMGIIIVAPSFDRERFYGYRYLWGSPIGADQFLMQVVDSYRRHYPSYDGRIFLFGHSAGGQFAQRFLVTHPGRVIAAAISSAGTFAYPDDSVEWPYGRWNSPNPAGFLEAAALPVRVIAGAFDTKDLSDQGVGQRGNTAVERAQAWAESMQALAYEGGVESGVHVVTIPAAAHSAWEIDISVVWWFAGIAGQ